MAAGVKTFERQAAPGAKSAYRLTQEGLDSMLPRLEKQVVRASAEEVEAILRRQQGEPQSAEAQRKDLLRDPDAPEGCWEKETLRATSSSNLCARNVAPASTGASPTPHPCQAYSVLVSSCSHSSNENDAPAAPHPPTGSAAPPVPTACSVHGPTRPPSTRRTSAAAPCAAGVDEANRARRAL